MKTAEEQQAFFESHWEAIQRAAEGGGSSAVLAFIDGFGEATERRVLHLLLRQGLANREWKGRNFDVLVGVARGGIDRILAEGDASDDETVLRRSRELANVICYNLTADLADCWNEGSDAMERTRSHHEAGLRAAEDCVRWREELEKGPAALSMAWWAKGMHQLSLDRAADAVASFERSLRHAEEASDSTEDFSSVLGRGYLGLARWIEGEDEGRALYRDALSTFANQLMDDDRKDDARFGIDQLETVKSRYGPAEPVDAS